MARGRSVCFAACLAATFHGPSAARFSTRRVAPRAFSAVLGSTAPRLPRLRGSAHGQRVGLSHEQA